VLHFFTDQHADYHAATDDAARSTRRARRASSISPTRLARLGRRPLDAATFQRGRAAPRMAGAESPAGARPWLGSVPDMSSDGRAGAQAAGVTPTARPTRPGLKAGDVVVAMDDAPVTDLYTTPTRSTRGAGRRARVTVLRGARSA
jgi:hypothetical protein